ncbi:MAG: deoxyribodipyrimidine photolyase [Cypionkella sp.]|uniref:FAD-binding domain-containing protein n=1 Tax=Cypionkella sp. TaxID=2811411 RepID=UPI002624F608|nr:FAD-binding domain-containing protein [Cypionkella sp.]MDB5658178.1 deoxyribodipyrimidine photolyase [Cypionkella sp.]
MNVLIWFKRDLRSHDHAALACAAGLGAVLPVYIVEPDYWALPDTSARQWAFTAECLEDLRQQLADLGAPLLVRVGVAQAVLERLCRQHNITQIVSHAEIGNAFSHARNQAVQRWARSAGIIWTELPQSDPEQPATIGNLRALNGAEPGQIPTARSLRLADDPCAHRQRGGRSQALDLLESFLSHRGESYRTTTHSPLAAERGSSRLSPHLALGTVSSAEVTQALQTRLAERPGGRWNAALGSFQSLLNARTLNKPCLETPPNTLGPSASAELLRRNSDAARLHAWQNGETGLPYLDACLRYLAATGWLNHRARAMVIGFAACQLRLDWRVAGAALARRLTDYDPGVHWSQVQIQCGTDETTPPRLYNPIKQGDAHDPNGLFTRRWIPELSAVPDAHLQAPWRWSGAGRVLGRRYPEPIVDMATAQRDAREAVWGVRRKPVARAEIVEVLERQVSPSPKRGQASHGQLFLDL